MMKIKKIFMCVKCGEAANKGEMKRPLCDFHFKEEENARRAKKH